MSAEYLSTSTSVVSATAMKMASIQTVPETFRMSSDSPFHENNNNYSALSNSTPGPKPEQAIPKRKKVGQQSAPYIPSYMDLTNGPEPCVVCGDAATGYHYRCMTCEGCKGFFRRTIQKNLKYHCKWNNNCVIDKNTRNQCQQCRFNKCLMVGMATDLVLNEKQRVAKRKLIEENRERRRRDQEVATVSAPMFNTSAHTVVSSPATSSGQPYFVLKESDAQFINTIVQAYEKSATRSSEPRSPVNIDHDDNTNKMWQQLAEVITPSIIKVVDFAKNVPGFESLDVDDQVLLLKSCCMEIMCLRAACRYNNYDQSLTLSNGYKLYKDQLNGTTNHGVSMLMAPIFEFSKSISRLDLDKTEVALLAAVLLMQSDRTGLKNPTDVENLQELVLTAFNEYVCKERHSTLGRWATILMKVTDLRSISTRHAERVMAVKLDKPTEIPSFFFEMFDESDNSHVTSTLTPQHDVSPLLTPFLKSPSSTGLFTPISLQKFPTFNEAAFTVNSPILKTPNLLTTVTPFWSGSNLTLPNLPIAPKTPKTPGPSTELIEHSDISVVQHACQEPFK